MEHLALGEIGRGDAGGVRVLRVEVGLGAAEVAHGVKAVGQEVGVTLGQRGAADDEHAAPEGGEDDAKEDIGAPALLDELRRRDAGGARSGSRLSRREITATPPRRC